MLPESVPEEICSLVHRVDPVQKEVLEDLVDTADPLAKAMLVRMPNPIAEINTSAIVSNNL